MKLTQGQLEAIRQRAENATPGPWILSPEKCGPDGQGVYEAESFGHICEVGDPYPRGNNRPQENMEFIAHARTDIPLLLDHIAELEAELARLKDALIEVSELSDEFFNVEVIDGQPTFVLKEGLEAYSDIIHEIAIVSNEAVNERDDGQ